MIDRLVAVGRRTGAEAVHPGYGFLAENARFAEACRAAGLVFVGPPPAAIARMGDKTAARRAAVEARRAGRARAPPGPVGSDAEAHRAARRPRLPGDDQGGPGRRREGHARSCRSRRSSSRRCGWRAPRRPPRSVTARSTSRRRSSSPATSRSRSSRTPTARSCTWASASARSSGATRSSIEESPSPAVDGALRAEMGGAACRLLASAGYQNAGTVEFLLDAGGRFYFLEVNTRLQVEHPVTELVTGIDLVREQLRLAAGERLGYAPGATWPRAAGRSSAGSRPRILPPDSSRRPGRISDVAPAGGALGAASTRASTRAGRCRSTTIP